MTIEIKHMDTQGMYAWNGVYASSDAESFVAECDPQAHAYDLIAGSVSLDDVADGIHECTVYGKPAVAYIWTHTSHEMRRGLVVLSSDAQGQATAKAKFDAKSAFL